MYDLHIGPDRSVFGPNLHLDRTDRSKQLRWTEPIGPGDTDGPDRTNSIGSIRLGLKSVGPGRYRSSPDRGCPYLFEMIHHQLMDWFSARCLIIVETYRLIIIKIAQS